MDKTQSPSDDRKSLPIGGTATDEVEQIHHQSESLDKRPDNEENEKKRSSRPTWKSYLTVAILFAGYIGLNYLGSVIFLAIERTRLDGTLHPFTSIKAEFVRIHGSNLTMEALNDFLKELEGLRDKIDQESIFENETVYADEWTINEGFVLSFSIASTIGYGVLTPKTEGGQMFAIFYALISIPFTGLLAAKLGSILAYFIKKASAIVFKDRKSNRRIKTASILFTFLLGLFVYIMIPTFVLAYADSTEEWTFVESLYCIFITLTTIGFGDYVPDPHAAYGIAGSILVLIWVVAGLAWVATIVNLLATTISKQASSLKKKVANQHIYIKTLKSSAAVIGGHKFSRRFRPKASSYSLEKGAEYSDEETGHTADESSREGSWDQLKPQDTQNPNAHDKETPSSVNCPSSGDGRRESKCSKRDDGAMGPNGLMSVVVNNMEDYNSSDMIEEHDS